MTNVIFCAGQEYSLKMQQKMKSVPLSKARKNYVSNLYSLYKPQNILIKNTESTKKDIADLKDGFMKMFLTYQENHMI